MEKNKIERSTKIIVEETKEEKNKNQNWALQGNLYKHSGTHALSFCKIENIFRRHTQFFRWVRNSNEEKKQNTASN